MDKATIDLDKIRNIKLSFCLPIQTDQDQKYHYKLLQKTKWGEKEYLKITPKPYVILELTNKDNWRDKYGNSIILTKPYFFSLLNKLKKFIYAYQIPELYQYSENGELLVNKPIAEANRLELLALNRILKMQHCVVKDEEGSNTEYEGCCVFVNHPNNYTLLTYEEIIWLYETLSQINFHMLSLQLIQITLEGDKIPYEEWNQVETVKEETIEASIKSGPQYKGNTIPNLM